MLHVEPSQDTDQSANASAMEAFGNVIGEKLTAATSSVISNVIGTITSGTVGVAADGPALKPYTSLYVVATNKPKSVSAVTFTLEQVVWVNNAFQVFLIGTITVTPGHSSYVYLALPEPKTNSTYRAVANAAYAYPTGVDNFVLTATGF